MSSAPDYPIPRPFIGSLSPNSEEGGTVDTWREISHDLAMYLATDVRQVSDIVKYSQKNSRFCRERLKLSSFSSDKIALH